MTNPDYKALCAELTDRLQHAITSANADSYYGENRDAVDRARAALSQPEPVAPTAWMYQTNPDFDGKHWHENWKTTLDEKLARYMAGKKEPIPLWRSPTPQPEPVAPTDEESDAFAIVQMRLDDLAGDQELMIYRWPDGEWSIDHTNPTSSVQLGEINGVYGSTGRILEDVVFALAAQLSAKKISEEN